MLTQIFSAHRKGFSRRVGKERPFHGFFDQIFKKFPSYSAVVIHVQSPKPSRSFHHLSFCEPSHVTPRSDVTSPLHPSLCIPKTSSFLSSQGEWKFKKGSSCWSEESLLCFNLALGRSPRGLLEQEQSLPHTRPLSLLKSCTHVARPSPYLVSTYE